MIIIYDFDGTLTPYAYPQYSILEKCHLSEIALKEKMKETIKDGYNFYEAYYKVYEDTLKENGFVFSKENVCMGAQNVRLHKGVKEYFENFQSSKTDIKHYIITSGFEAYVKETIVTKWVDGIYGTTYEQKDGIFQKVDVLLTDKMKVDFIKKIQKENPSEKIVYFGDGITDQYAFEYVHSIKGKTVFVSSDEESKKIYKQLNKNGDITECFEGNFERHSAIWQFVQNLK